MTYPVGLLTIDEVYLAGGSSNNNSNYYLYTGNSYFTMTPYQFNGSNATVRYVLHDGNVNAVIGTASRSGVRPVINLKPDSLKTGDGTASNPYQVE